MRKRLIGLGLFAGMSALGCSSKTADDAAQDQTPTAPSSLLATGIEPSGTNCENGGVWVSYGADDDTNLVLDEDEVEGTSYVCAPVGLPGPAGTNGENGATGPAGTNGENGATGATGPAGTNGENGATGPAGPAGGAGPEGAPGFNSLLVLTEEPAGTNCKAGGTRVDVGLDNGDGLGTPNDGQLQADEVDESDFICLPVPEPHIYWVEKNNDGSGDDYLVRTDLDGSGKTHVTTSPAYVVQYFGAFLNVTPTSFYWVEKENGGSGEDRIVRTNLDGTGRQYVVTSAQYAVQNFGYYLTATNDALYWVEKENGGSSEDRIVRTNLDGTERKNIFASAAFAVQKFGSYLNVTNDALYWVEKENGGSGEDRIVRTNLDGTGKETIVASEQYAVQNFGSYLNVTNDALYWIEEENGGSNSVYIVRTKLDGTEKTVLRTGESGTMKFPFMKATDPGANLTVTDDSLFWVQQENGGSGNEFIVRSDLNGENEAIVYTSAAFAVQKFGSFLNVR